MTGIPETTRSRVASLPTGPRRCCGDVMRIRRSSLRPEPCADDVLLKCMACYCTQTHGIPITRDEYEREMAERGRRTVDAVRDGPASVEENLHALGYLEY